MQHVNHRASNRTNELVQKLNELQAENERLQDDNAEMRALLRQARDELNVIASYKADLSVTVGLRTTARAYDRLVMRIDAALAGGEPKWHPEKGKTYEAF